MPNELRYDNNVVEDLIASAKEHFLENGYAKASLRKICAAAGVTTGALYFSFANKEALFDAVIGPTVRKLDAYWNEVEGLILKSGGKAFDENKFNDYVFKFVVENKDGIRLLMARAEGSQYESFSKKFHESVETLMTHYAKSVHGVDMDPIIVSILTNMYFTAIEDLLSRDYNDDEMVEVAGALRVSMEEGFYAMLRHQKEKG